MANVDEPILNHRKTTETHSAVLVDPYTQQLLMRQLRDRISPTGDDRVRLPEQTVLLLEAGATLTRALTTHGADVRQLALEVMRQASIENPQITTDPSATTGVVIEAQGTRFGRLTADAQNPNTLKLWADWLGNWLKLESEMRELYDMAMRDELTGAWNRRFLYPFLEQQIESARRRGAQVTVMAFDIDNFKQFNDRFGHGVGDEVLKQTVQLLQAEIRDTDIVARVGGDEFVVVFWDAREKHDPDSKHPNDVLQATQRFREALKQQRFSKLASDMPDKLSVSGGLAAFPSDGDTADALLRHADLVATAAKQQGKNAITYGNQ